MKRTNPIWRPRPALAGCALAACLVLASSVPVRALVLGGSFRTSIYSQKSRLGAEPFGAPNSKLENRTQLLETVRLDALQLGRPGISFHTAFTGSNVLTDQSVGDTRFRFYRGYLQSAGRLGEFRCDARLGRQWVLAGVGSGLIDGLSLQATRANWGGLDGYFGTLGTDRLGRTDRFWSLDSPSDSRSYGGRLRLARSLGQLQPNLAVSYAQAERTPHADLVTDVQRIGLHGDLSLARGATGLRFLQGWRAWGDYRHDLILGQTIGAAAGLDYFGGPRGLHGWIEGNQRRPSLPATSFFAPFESKTVNQARCGLGARVYKQLDLSLGADVITFGSSLLSTEDAKSEKGLELLLSGYGATIGYRFHGGYGGDLSGLVLYGHRDLGEKLDLDASIGVTQYKFGESVTDSQGRLDPEDQNETTGILAAAYRLLPALTVTGQVEGLANEGFKHDVRFLGIANWRFRTAL